MKSDNEGLHNQTSMWETTAWWAGNIGPSKCNKRSFRVFCKNEAVEWLYLSSIWVIWVQHCSSKHKQQWLQSCHTVPTWLLRGLCIYLVLPTLPRSCCPLSLSLRVYTFMVVGRLVKKITLRLEMFSSTFDQKEISQEEVVFALK